MATYKDNKTKTWYFRVYVYENGKRKQKWRAGFKTKTEAKIAEQNFLLSFNKNNNYENMIFNDLYNIYILHKKQTVKPKSYVNIKNIFETHILPYFKDYKLCDITSQEYMNWKAKIIEKNYTYKYNSSIHIFFVNILNFAMKFYNLDKNVASKVGNFSKANYIRKVDFWTYEEFKQFINAIDNDIIYYSLFNTLYFSGIRIGEALALNWIDFKDNSININKTISRSEKGNNYIITTPKTNSSIRKIKLDNNTVEILNNLKNFFQRTKNFSEDWFIFGGLKPLARTTITTKKNYYCNIAKIKQIRIHDFRHSHASLLISKGVPLPVISKRLGHNKISTTLDIYSHMIPNDEEKAIEIINELNKIRGF